MGSHTRPELTCPTNVPPRAYFVTIYHMSDKYGVADTEQCYAVFSSDSIQNEQHFPFRANLPDLWGAARIFRHNISYE